MLQLEEILHKHYPNETMKKQYVSIFDRGMERTTRIPFAIFKDPKLNLVQSIRIINTDSYWFIDNRDKIKHINYGLFIGISTVIMLLFLFLVFDGVFVRLLPNIPIWFISLLIMVAILQMILMVFTYHYGLKIQVFKNEWVDSKNENNKLHFHAVVLNMRRTNYGNSYLVINY